MLSGKKGAALLRALLALCALVLATPASAHPAPFSYLDISLGEDRIEGRLTVHAIDLAHDLGREDLSQLLTHDALEMQHHQIVDLLRKRFSLSGDAPLAIQWGEVLPLADKQAVQLEFHVPDADPGALTVTADMFPYDPQHQTFVNIYEGRSLSEQWILSGQSKPRTHYRGTAAGVWAVMTTFVPSGVHHIWIGPDHILFLVGLLLLGGSMGQLVRIVTAFTLGHSLTLALAALDIVNIPARLVEPAIALTIVFVGADNLLRGQGRDLRAPLAGVFGLVHGFGFASVLREFGLPQEALGWSLFSFNVGVELGQLVLVVPIALLVNAIRRRSELMGKRVVVAGSVLVIAAGLYWFVERVTPLGGS